MFYGQDLEGTLECLQIAEKRMVGKRDRSDT